MQISDVFFNNYITLEKPSNVKDSSGGVRKTWVTVTDTPIKAAIQPMTPREQHLYAGRQIRASHSVYIEEDPRFKRGYRLVDQNGKKFVIKGIVDFAGANRVYKIICRELVE